MMSKSTRFLLSICSGLLLTFSFPYTGSQTYLIFIALIPLLFVEQEIRIKSYRPGKLFIHAHLTFLIYNVGTTWWIWNASQGGAIMAFVLNSLLMAIAFFTYHLLLRKLGDSFGLLALISIWVGFEFLHFNWELSWPWLTFGNVFALQTDWVQWYSITGALGGSIWVLTINYLGFQIIYKYLKTKQIAKTSTLLFIGCLAFPVILSNFISYTIEKKDSIRVALLQPNIDPYLEKFNDPIEIQMDKMIALTKDLKQIDYYIAPETAISNQFYEPNWEQEISALKLREHIQKTKGNWIIGAATYEIFDTKKSRASRKLPDGPGYIEFYNTALFMDTQFHTQINHKSKLVLGVEKLPFSNIFPFIEELSIDNGGTSGTLGIEEEPNVMGNTTLFAPVICYESIYGNFVRTQVKKGADFIAIITNDGWWGNTPGYRQHLALGALRAIENRRYVVRSANTGSSAIIDPTGKIRSKTKYWVPACISTTIFKQKGQTFYQHNGDYLGLFALYLSLGLAVVYALKRWKKSIK